MTYRYVEFRPRRPSETAGTNFLMGANAVTFFLSFLNLLPQGIYRLFVSDSLTAWHVPWTFFTYPLVTVSGDAFKFLNFLFALLWLFFVGSMLERRWGTRRFLFSFFMFSAASAFFLAVGSLIVGVPIGFGELWLPLVDLTVVWAALEPQSPVLFFFIPMRLGWLALITCGLLLFQYGSIHPLLGAFSLGGCGVAYVYTRYFDGEGQLRSFNPPSPSSGTSSLSRLNPFNWYRRWRFKRRFKKLWGE